MAHIFIQANPLLAADELGLKRRFGLRQLHARIDAERFGFLADPGNVVNGPSNFKLNGVTL